MYDDVISFSEGNGKYLCDRSRLCVRPDAEVQDNRLGIQRQDTGDTDNSE